MSDPRFEKTPKNGCSGCRRDFASVAAFDRHRIGTFEPNERDCMTDAEMGRAGMELDPRGRWCIRQSEATRKSLQELRRSSQRPSEALGGGDPS